MWLQLQYILEVGYVDQPSVRIDIVGVHKCEKAIFSDRYKMCTKLKLARLLGNMIGTAMTGGNKFILQVSVIIFPSILIASWLSIDWIPGKLCFALIESRVTGLRTIVLWATSCF